MKNIVIISPHLDDSIWSLGAFIKKTTEEKTAFITVINVFSKMVFVFDKQVSDRVASGIRKTEDKFSLRLAGVKNVINLDFPEALIRGYKFSEIFIEDKKAYADSVKNKVKESLEKLAVIKKADLILIPSGFGGHIDHLITRDAASQIAGKKLSFYGEIPYVGRKVRIQNATKFLKNRTFSKISVADYINWHKALMSIYVSQIKFKYLKTAASYFEDGVTIWK